VEFYSCAFLSFLLSTLSSERKKGFLIYPIISCLFGNGLRLFLLFFLLFYFSISYLRDIESCAGFSFEIFPFGIPVIPRLRQWVDRPI